MIEIDHSIFFLILIFQFVVFSCKFLFFFMPVGGWACVYIALF